MKLNRKIQKIQKLNRKIQILISQIILNEKNLKQNQKILK